MAEPEFEKLSLEKLTSTEHIDKLLVVVGMKGWIALIVIIALSIGVLVWSFVAEIPINISGRGIIYNPDAVTRIRAMTEGVVKNIPVHRGDVVEPGDLLVELESPALETSIEKQKIKMEQLSHEMLPPEKEEDRKWALLMEQVELNALETRAEHLSISASHSGTIVDITGDIGETVSTGTTLMWMQSKLPAGEAESVYAFIDPEVANEIEVGFETKMTVAGVDAQRYGLLLGKVKQIYTFSASFSSEYIGQLPSQDLRDYLTGKAAKIMILIELLPDPSFPSGYKWTSKGPSSAISPGMVGVVHITVEKLRPISYVLPFIK